ncbi:ADP-ribosylation factor GTPase-activating protein AGD12-like isoform X1 [Iris pallida]|uniref:ADP-ribosylation factor GTPase-activating protein AGD12-like isoform X1 n=1 Tax=Iris pallida TaxID=29817 RepID=A0AAX6GCL1_IRIPA|nr:ADP-ribosylation factor GTPase-activating protein AGD12-like isoform X1 [Iris pallida]
MSVQERPSRASTRKLKELLHKSENRICADCCAPDPKWASSTIGVFICIKCCGVHRSLGTHISKVLSLTLDDWSEEEMSLWLRWWKLLRQFNL